jgi:pantoate--beta-alanine ligase
LQILQTIAQMRAAHRGAGRGLGDLGLVPTMGYLHAGHLSLVERAKAECGAVAVSIFVNPTQFGPGEDLSRYPRDLPRDLGLLEAAGVDLVFAPEPSEIYPPGFATEIRVGGVTDVLEGAVRPGHFAGVATVVAKLFNIVQPTRAYFGQKDAQQVAVVKRMVRDLDHEVQIRVVPTVRDSDGLALSSRNAHLSPEERELALTLPRALATKDAVEARARLNGFDVDYVEVADFEPRVLAAAVRVGKTRLIDNVILDKEESP